MKLDAQANLELHCPHMSECPSLCDVSGSEEVRAISDRDKREQSFHTRTLRRDGKTRHKGPIMELSHIEQVVG